MGTKTKKNCGTCACWKAPQQGFGDRGECRAQPPTTAGWPKTVVNDYCLAGWRKSTAAVSSEENKPRPQPIGCLGFDYAYILKYQDNARTWLLAVQSARKIPKDLCDVIADPLGGIVTRDLPVLADRGLCCDDLLQWANKLPGYSNDAEEPGDDDWMGIMCYLDDPAVREKNEAIRATIPAEHPWRDIPKQQVAALTA